MTIRRKAGSRRRDSRTSFPKRRRKSSAALRSRASTAAKCWHRPVTMTIRSTLCRGRGRRRDESVGGGHDAEDILFSTTAKSPTIVLNRPQKLNAVTPEMANAIMDAIVRCNEERRRFVVWCSRGAGDRAFCAGSDIKRTRRLRQPWSFRNRPDYCDAIRRLSKAVDRRDQRLRVRRRPGDRAELRYPHRVGERSICGAGDQAWLDRRRRHDGLPHPRHRRFERGPHGADGRSDRCAARLGVGACQARSLRRKPFWTARTRSPRLSQPGRRSRPKPQNSICARRSPCRSKRRSNTSGICRRSASRQRTRPRAGRHSKKGGRPFSGGDEPTKRGEGVVTPSWTCAVIDDRAFF